LRGELGAVLIENSLADVFRFVQLRPSKPASEVETIELPKLRLMRGG
jgi:hypothetical protein